MSAQQNNAETIPYRRRDLGSSRFLFNHLAFGGDLAKLHGLSDEVVIENDIGAHGNKPLDVLFIRSAARAQTKTPPEGGAVATAVWWTRRELNPRPKVINGQDYMFSSVI